MKESFSALFKESMQNININSGSIIKGKIISINKKHVLVDTNLKSESIVPIKQFLNSNKTLEINIGDKVDFMLDTIEDGFGRTVLSREKAKRYKAWMDLEKAYKSGNTVYGIINARVKGGFYVDLSGIRSFLPGSLSDINPTQDEFFSSDKEFEFKVIKLDQKNNNIVVSRRDLFQLDNLIEKNQAIASLKEGEIVQGIVKNLTNYGAFIDLGGLDGLLHITDISWKRIKHPNEIINIGDKILVKILKFDKMNIRISLGLKQLTKDPWFAVAKKYPEKTQFLGKVTNLTDYGCFVEISDGIEGLVHISEMNWTNKNINPAKLVYSGKMIKVMVLDINKDRRRISLGIKQCIDNPWINFCHKYKKGDKVIGKIKSITDFGIFIGLEGGIDGLIHLSDISINFAKNSYLKKYKKDDIIKAVILQADAKKERISLGIKQLMSYNFYNFMELHKKNDIILAKVSKINLELVVFQLDKNVVGHLYLSNQNKKINTKFFKIGKFIRVKLCSFDKKNFIVLLTLDKLKVLKNKKNKDKKFSSTMSEAFKNAKK